MSHKTIKTLIGCASFSIQLLICMHASAVGNGVPFVFREGFVPGAAQNPVAANSLDFTYHACDNFTAAGAVTETGYFWVSSFQNVGTVVDSQINHFLPNGYHLYARYHFSADECSDQQTCNGRTRKSYFIEQAGLSLYLDPLQDTVLGLQNCGVVAAGTADDVFLGNAMAIQNGQKSETDDLANGDFEIVLGNWAFTAAGQALFTDGNGNPLVVQVLVFNANVTMLNGPLVNDHLPEGSGNIYWRD